MQWKMDPLQVHFDLKNGEIPASYMLVYQILPEGMYRSVVDPSIFSSQVFPLGKPTILHDVHPTEHVSGFTG